MKESGYTERPLPPKPSPHKSWHDQIRELTQYDGVRVILADGEIIDLPGMTLLKMGVEIGRAEHGDHFAQVEWRKRQRFINTRRIQYYEEVKKDD